MQFQPLKFTVDFGTSGPPSTTETDETCIVDSTEEIKEIEHSAQNNDMWGSIPYELSQSAPSADIILEDSNVLEIFSQPNFNISGGSSAVLSVGNYSVNDLG